MENNPYFKESYWFIRVLETEEYKYDMIKNTYLEFDEKNYTSFSKILENIEILNDDNSQQSEHLFNYLIKIASESKFNGAKEFSDVYRKYFNKELPKNLENCFKKHDEIYLCLNEILNHDEVIRIDINQIFNWIGEYIDLFIILELVNDLFPSKKNRHRNQLDSELRDYLLVRTKYLNNEDEINLFKYKKYRNFNFHWFTNRNVSPELISNFMSDLFSEKINRIDNFYLPTIVKQIWFVNQINDRQLYAKIIPLIKLLKSIDKKSSHRRFHATEAEFKKDKILADKEAYSDYNEYCYHMINRLVKTNKEKHS
jgi:hypothetical protein